MDISRRCAATFLVVVDALAVAFPLWLQFLRHSPINPAWLTLNDKFHACRCRNRALRSDREIEIERDILC